MEVADTVWDGGVSYPVSSWKGLKVRTIDRFMQVPRRIAGTVFTMLGTYVLLSCLINWNQLKHFQYVYPVQEKTVYIYKDAPAPPEPGFDTGNVIIKHQWHSGKGKDAVPTGEYQVETPDGVVSTWKFCSNPIAPTLDREEKFNIHVITDQQEPISKEPCTKFVRARRWK